MTRPLRLLLLLFFFSGNTSLLFAQQESSLMSYGGDRNGAGSSLFRDYQAMGVNPANLGIFSGDDVQVTLGAFEVNGLFYSDALPKSDIMNSLIKGDPLTDSEKLSIARNFLETGNSFTGEVMPFGIAIQFPGFGGVGFTWRERMTGNVQLSEPFADLVFNGLDSKYIDTIIYDVLGQAIGLLPDSVNVGDLFNGSHLQFNWLREFNVSFGTQLLHEGAFKLYAGAGIKFLQSNAIADVSFEGDSVTGFAAFSKLFDIDYSNFTDPATEFKGRLSPVGKGFGIDLGTTFSYEDKLFGAVSVTDIGSIKYQGNLVTVTNSFRDSLINFVGINEANIFTSFDDLFNAEGLFQYLPSGDKTVALPTQLHVGAGWHATPKLDVALDMIQPLNHQPGNLLKAQYAALVNVTPVKALRISGGVVGGGFADFNVPLGIGFSFTPHQIWQLSVGTQDIISLLTQNKPTVSLNLSLLRFHFE